MLRTNVSPTRATRYLFSVRVKFRLSRFSAETGNASNAFAVSLVIVSANRKEWQKNKTTEPVFSNEKRRLKSLSLAEREISYTGKMSSILDGLFSLTATRHNCWHCINYIRNYCCYGAVTKRYSLVISYII